MRCLLQYEYPPKIHVYITAPMKKFRGDYDLYLWMPGYKKLPNHLYNKTDRADTITLEQLKHQAFKKKYDLKCIDQFQDVTDEIPSRFILTDSYLHPIDTVQVVVQKLAQLLGEKNQPSLHARILIRKAAEAAAEAAAEETNYFIRCMIRAMNCWKTRMGSRKSLEANTMLSWLHIVAADVATKIDENVLQLEDEHQLLLDLVAALAGEKIVHQFALNGCEEIEHVDPRLQDYRFKYSYACGCTETFGLEDDLREHKIKNKKSLNCQKKLKSWYELKYHTLSNLCPELYVLFYDVYQPRNAIVPEYLRYMKALRPILIDPSAYGATIIQFRILTLLIDGCVIQANQFGTRAFDLFQTIQPSDRIPLIWLSTDRKIAQSTGSTKGSTVANEDANDIFMFKTLCDFKFEDRFCSDAWFRNIVKESKKSIGDNKRKHIRDADPRLLETDTKLFFVLKVRDNIVLGKFGHGGMLELRIRCDGRLQHVCDVIGAVKDHLPLNFMGDRGMASFTFELTDDRHLYASRNVTVIEVCNQQPSSSDFSFLDNINRPEHDHLQRLLPPFQQSELVCAFTPSISVLDHHYYNVRGQPSSHATVHVNNKRFELSEKNCSLDWTSYCTLISLYQYQRRRKTIRHQAEEPIVPRPMRSLLLLPNQKHTSSNMRGDLQDTYLQCWGGSSNQQRKITYMCYSEHAPYIRRWSRYSIFPEYIDYFFFSEMDRELWMARYKTAKQLGTDYSSIFDGDPDDVSPWKGLSEKECEGSCKRTNGKCNCAYCEKKYVFQHRINLYETFGKPKNIMEDMWSVLEKTLKTEKDKRAYLRENLKYMLDESEGEGEGESEQEHTVPDWWSIEDMKKALIQYRIEFTSLVKDPFLCNNNKRVYYYSPTYFCHICKIPLGNSKASAITDNNIFYIYWEIVKHAIIQEESKLERLQKLREKKIPAKCDRSTKCHCDECFHMHKSKLTTMKSENKICRRYKKQMSQTDYIKERIEYYNSLKRRSEKKKQWSEQVLRKYFGKKDGIYALFKNINSQKLRDYAEFYYADPITEEDIKFALEYGNKEQQYRDSRVAVQVRARHTAEQKAGTFCSLHTSKDSDAYGVLQTDGKGGFYIRYDSEKPDKAITPANLCIRYRQLRVIGTGKMRPNDSTSCFEDGTPDSKTGTRDSFEIAHDEFPLDREKEFKTLWGEYDTCPICGTGYKYGVSDYTCWYPYDATKNNQLLPKTKRLGWKWIVNKKFYKWWNGHDVERKQKIRSSSFSNLFQFYKYEANSKVPESGVLLYKKRNPGLMLRRIGWANPAPGHFVKVSGRITDPKKFQVGGLVAKVMSTHNLDGKGYMDYRNSLNSPYYVGIDPPPQIYDRYNWMSGLQAKKIRGQTQATVFKTGLVTGRNKLIETKLRRPIRFGTGSQELIELFEDCNDTTIGDFEMKAVPPAKSGDVQDFKTCIDHLWKILQEENVRCETSSARCDDVVLITDWDTLLERCPISRFCSINDGQIVSLFRNDQSSNQFLFSPHIMPLSLMDSLCLDGHFRAPTFKLLNDYSTAVEAARTYVDPKTKIYHDSNIIWGLYSINNTIRTSEKQKKDYNNACVFVVDVVFANDREEPRTYVRHPPTLQLEDYYWVPFTSTSTKCRWIYFAVIINITVKNDHDVFPKDLQLLLQRKEGKVPVKSLFRFYPKDVEYCIRHNIKHRKQAYNDGEKIEDAYLYMKLFNMVQSAQIRLPRALTNWSANTARFATALSPFNHQMLFPSMRKYQVVGQMISTIDGLHQHQITHIVFGLEQHNRGVARNDYTQVYTRFVQTVNDETTWPETDGIQSPYNSSDQRYCALPLQPSAFIEDSLQAGIDDIDPRCKYCEHCEFFYEPFPSHQSFSIDEYNDLVKKLIERGFINKSYQISEEKEEEDEETGNLYVMLKNKQKMTVYNEKKTLSKKTQVTEVSKTKNRWTRVHDIITDLVKRCKTDKRMCKQIRAMGDSCFEKNDKECNGGLVCRWTRQRKCKTSSVTLKKLREVISPSNVKSADKVAGAAVEYVADLLRTNHLFREMIVNANFMSAEQLFAVTVDDYIGCAYVPGVAIVERPSQLWRRILKERGFTGIDRKRYWHLVYDERRETDLRKKSGIELDPSRTYSRSRWIPLPPIWRMQFGDAYMLDNRNDDGREWSKIENDATYHRVLLEQDGLCGVRMVAAAEEQWHCRFCTRWNAAEEQFCKHCEKPQKREYKLYIRKKPINISEIMKGIFSWAVKDEENESEDSDDPDTVWKTYIQPNSREEWLACINTFITTQFTSSTFNKIRRQRADDAWRTLQEQTRTNKELLKALCTFVNDLTATYGEDTPIFDITKANNDSQTYCSFFESIEEDDLPFGGEIFQQICILILAEKLHMNPTSVYSCYKYSKTLTGAEIKRCNDVLKVRIPNVYDRVVYEKRRQGDDREDDRGKRDGGSPRRRTKRKLSQGEGRQTQKKGKGAESQETDVQSRDYALLFTEDMLTRILPLLDIYPDSDKGGSSSGGGGRCRQQLPPHSNQWRKSTMKQKNGAGNVRHMRSARYRTRGTYVVRENQREMS